MEMLVLGSTLIVGMARGHQKDGIEPLFDALDNPWPALWTILGTIAVAALAGCGFSSV